MILGTVLGTVELLRSVSGAEEKRFVQVKCGAQLLTALDPIGGKNGALVLLTAGACASRLCPACPVDAVVLGVAGNNG